MSETFKLRWNDFQSNVSKSFGLFRKESYLQDITLVSDDLETMSAHKLVLSACSEYFKNLLQKTERNSQTLLVLDGIISTDLRNVLDYVYDGEVRIAQDEIDRFLKVARKLKLEGLGQEEAIDVNEEDMKAEDVSESEEDLPKTRDFKPRYLGDDKVSIINNYGESMSESEHKKRLQENVIEHADWSASCKICGKIFQAGKRKRDSEASARRHVEIHFDGLTYRCAFCNKEFRSRNVHNSHVSKAHFKSLQNKIQYDEP